MFCGIYRNRRVLVTGHSGFKGSWLSLWLLRMGAEICGVALPMKTRHSHFSLLGLGKRKNMRSEYADIRCPETLERIVSDFRPEIVFHLAAQPLVRLSYEEPVETFETNVMGTIHLLEACRRTDSVRAVVAVTSDKCYENSGSGRPFREADPMGGYDPYSASKGCAELAVSCWRRSFFHSSRGGGGEEERPGGSKEKRASGDRSGLLLASARAGNVIGGGDWAENRLVPDLMKAAEDGKTVTLRNPSAVRPWQHVLEPLSGYLQLGSLLWRGHSEFAEGWNFGPSPDEFVTVRSAAEQFAGIWDRVRFRMEPDPDAPHEAPLLRLDCSKAAERLGWHGVWDSAEAFRKTAEWYRAFLSEGTLNTERDLDEYLLRAEERKLEWIK